MLQAGAEGAHTLLSLWLLSQLIPFPGFHSAVKEEHS